MKHQYKTYILCATGKSKTDLRLSFMKRANGISSLFFFLVVVIGEKKKS